MNKRISLAVRDPQCSKCLLGQRDLSAQDRCVTAFGPHTAKWMILTNYPVGKDTPLYKMMVEKFALVGLDATSAVWASALKCRTWEVTPKAKEIKTCSNYLEAEIDFVKPEYAISFGNEALYLFSGTTAGVTKYKGKVSDYKGVKVFHTVSPNLALRKPSQMPSLVADLQYFANLMGNVEKDKYHLPIDVRTVQSIRKLHTLKKELDTASLVSFDAETTTLNEFLPEAKMVSLSLTISQIGDIEDAVVWRIPLFHPQSVFKHNWPEILDFIGPVLNKIPKRIAHNGKFDCRWLRRFGGSSLRSFTYTFDTIMALALLNENEGKGLKESAQRILGAEPWGIDTKNLLETLLSDILDYNGLDTWHTLRLYFYLKKQLQLNPRQGNFFSKLSMPAMNALISMESVGVYVDREKLDRNGRVIRRNLSRALNELMEYLPPDSEIPSNLKSRKGEPIINWRPSNFSRWFLFEHLGLPVIRRGKDKQDGSPGMPSMGKAELLALKDHHPTVPLLLERAKWGQLDTTFITAYEELLDDNSRLRTVFKPWKPVTGRMSSGGEDEEKATGALQGKSLNLQQVPQERLVRSVIGARPGWWFVAADYSQVELRVAAYLAQESTMLHLYQTGQDIHTAAAMQMTGKPKDKVTKEERQKAKARNFGFLYGMGWAKFMVQAWLDYGIKFSEAEAKANRDSFFEQFPKLRHWHFRQKQIAAKYGRVQTPMGRIRHLPDIHSSDEAIQAEAERQAINSPVQAMASDLTQLSMVLIERRFRKYKIKGHAVGFVHDAVNFEIHESSVEPALRIIKHTMENLPLDRLFRLNLNVPLVADLQIGHYWGEGRELTTEQIETGDVW